MALEGMGGRKAPASFNSTVKNQTGIDLIPKPTQKAPIKPGSPGWAPLAMPKSAPKPAPKPTAPKPPATKIGGTPNPFAPVIRNTGGDSGAWSNSKSSSEPTEADYLKGDATYQATVSALAKQLENYQADIQAQKSRYGLDFDKGIQDLGYIAPAEGGEGAWNWDDTLTASGRGYQNQLNDFASRGMTQSSAYADAINNLQRSLMDQYTGMSTAKNTFETDLDRQLASTKDENTAAQQAARAEAIMRRAMQYGLAV